MYVKQNTVFIFCVNNIKWEERKERERIREGEGDKMRIIDWSFVCLLLRMRKRDEMCWWIYLARYLFSHQNIYFASISFYIYFLLFWLLLISRWMQYAHWPAGNRAYMKEWKSKGKRELWKKSWRLLIMMSKDDLEFDI